MAVWSLVKASELEGARRLDAEYYRPIYLKERKALHSLRCVILGEVAFITDGQHGYHKLDPASDIKHITAKCIKENVVDVDSADRLALETHLKNKRAACEGGDVVVSTAGTIGNAGVVTSDILPANMDQDVARIHIREKGKLSPWYVSVFLNSAYGQLQTTLETTGQIQGHLALEKVRRLAVPIISSHQEVERLAIAAYEERRRFKALYLKAECLVLDAIGWDKLTLSQSKWWAVPLSRASGTHRLDAEHFQPKYDKLVAHLQKGGKAKQLGEFVPFIKRGLQPDYSEAGEILVVNSQHLGRFMVNVEDTERADAAFWNENKRCRLEKNDVLLYATGAYIGRTNIWLEDRKGIASNHVTIMRPDKSCDPSYLAVFLNAPCGILQADRWASGSGQREIYPEDIARFCVALPPEKVQEQVAKLVQQSYTARQKAKALLQEAKTKVEALIEGKRA